MRSLALLVVVAATCVMAGAADAQMAQDPVLGTWRLNVERSVWTPGPRPPADAYGLRQYMALEDDWYGALLTGRDADGNPTFEVGVWKVDGQQYPVHNLGTLSALMTTGRQSNLTRSYRVVDENTVEFTTYTDGVRGNPVVRQVASDGMTFLLIIEETNAQGVPVRNVIVFDKVN